MIFRSRHERFVAPGATTQMSLDLKADEVARVTVTDTKKITYTRTNVAVEKKPLVHPGRGKLPDHFRREDIVTDPERSAYALEQILKLYAIKRTCKEKNLSYDERKLVCHEQSVPILNVLGKWMTQEYTEAKVLPKSSIGIAMAYSIKRWDKLTRYTSNGMLAIDNNPVENILRPVALGRKNYLFAGSHEAAQRTAMIYSLLGSCKMQGVNPYLWLKDILTRISTHPINKIKQLLPHHWKQLQVQDADPK